MVASLYLPGTPSSDWFSHQHDVTYINNTTILVFDDGNTRFLTNPKAQSRGQEWVLNEQTMTATPVVNANLGGYSAALGSAQILPNGNLTFDSGLNGTAPNYYGESIEMLPNGVQTYVQDMSISQYRSYFMPSLYGPSSDLPPPGPPSPIPVNLSSAYNRTGIVANWSTFSGGLDTYGDALSGDMLGTTLPTADSVFNIGTIGSNDVVSGAGQTIALPASTDAALKLLATAVNGAQPNQTFTVTYTDGTTATLTQSISDWAVPQDFPGETTAYTFAYRDTAGGSIQGGLYRLYEYSLTLNPNKTVKSITLPNDANVELLAATLIPVVPTQINLSSAFNRTGIVTDGSTFSGGLDTYGDAYSANLLGSTVTVGGATFNFGPANTNNAISATGQTIALPASTDAALKLLATAVNGAQTNQTFTVTYTDGTTAKFTQSISDWAVPQNFFGETTAVTTAYRDRSNGTKQGGNFDVYEYTFTLNPAKTISSITLPNDANVEILAATLLPSIPAPVNPNLSQAFNRTGIVTDGTTFSGGLDTYGDALSANLLGTSVTVGGTTFNLGPANTDNVVSAAGQTIALPAGNDATLDLLATAVNGAQLKQTFTVTYTDGTTATLTQSFSDWAAPQNFFGETTAVTTAYRDTSGGGRQAGNYSIYAYAFALNPSKTVSTISLPSNANVEVLAISLS